MYKIQGKVIEIQEPQSGVSAKTGNAWTSQTFVIEAEENEYKFNVSFSVFNKILNFEEGDTVEVDFLPKSKFYEPTKRWFTQLDVEALTVTTKLAGMSKPIQPNKTQFAAEPHHKQPIALDDVPF